MRTRSCRRLGAFTCTSVKSIRIAYKVALRVRVAGRWLRREEIEALSRQDGFASLKDFVNFFRDTHGLPFEGDLIQW